MEASGITSMRQTCKAFHAIALDAADRISIRHPTPTALRMYSGLLRKSKRVTKISAELCACSAVDAAVLAAENGGIRNVTLRDTFGTLSHNLAMIYPTLTHMTLARNHDIRSMPLLPHSMRRIKITDCSALETISGAFTRCMTTLQSLEVRRCPKLSGDIAELLCGMTALNSLKISKVGDLTMGSQLDSAGGRFIRLSSNLQCIHLETSVGWDCAAFLGGCAQLSNLVLSIQLPLESMHFEADTDPSAMLDLCALTRICGGTLERLCLFGWNVINHMALADCHKLRCLSLEPELPIEVLEQVSKNASRLARLHTDLAFGELRADALLALQDASLRRAKLTFTHPLPETWLHSSLTTLVLHSCENVDPLLRSGSLPHLSTLELHACTMKTMHVSPSIRSLALHHNLFLEDVIFSPNSRVSRLVVNCCSQLTHLASVKHCKQLSVLDVSTCFALRTIAGIDMLPNLQHLNLCHLPNLQLADAQLPLRLQHLGMNNVACENAAPLSKCRKLQTLQLSSLSQSIDVSAIAKCAALTDVKVRCNSIHNVLALVRCKRLKVLTLMSRDGTQAHVLKKHFPKTFVYIVNI